MALVMCAVTFSAGELAAQSSDDDRRPLVEREPYDLLSIKGGKPIKVVAVKGREIPRNPGPRDLLKVRLLEDDEKQYEVPWTDVRIELFEQMLLREARKLTEAGKFDEAFRYFYRLKQSYDGLSGVDESLNRFHFLETRALASRGNYAAALSSIEELYRRDKDFRGGPNEPSVTAILDDIVTQLAKQYLDQRQYRAVRDLIRRAAEEFGAESLPSIERWQRQLSELAIAKREEAQGYVDKKDYRSAMEVVREMTRIWPDVEGGRQLDAIIARQYPVVRVGVLQPARSFDPHQLENWASRRAGRLIQRSLIDFLGPGPEGGQYEFALGLVERSDDRRSIVLRLDQAARDAGHTGYEVADRVLEIANPSSPHYSSAWGSLMLAASVQQVNQVHVEFRRPFVLPEALLTTSLDPSLPGTLDSTAVVHDGPFQAAIVSDRETRFQAKPTEKGTRLAEVVELVFDDPQGALRALRTQEVDMIDRLFPADAARLLESRSGDESIVVQEYALPTVHLLLVNADQPFLAERSFRRALVFGIDREAILNRELLGGRAMRGCRVISGPFPTGVSDTDPLAYAHDPTIEPRSYVPDLASLLVRNAQTRVRDRAENLDEPLPDRVVLVLGHPPLESARVVCQAIVAQWKIIGVDCVVQEFPTTRASLEAADLTYAEIAIREPLVDAHRLFGRDGLAPTNNPYVAEALRGLIRAGNWGEIREALLRLHRRVHDEVTVVPLWQTSNFFAYGRRIQDVGERPFWLYQFLDQWRIGDTGSL